MTLSLAIAGGTPVVPPGQHRSWPEITAKDRRAVAAVLDRSILCGATAPEVMALQKEWAWYCGTRHCLATNSGTAALHCAVAASGVRAGDEVIVPALTFVATAFAVAHQGAIPVFCDINPNTYNIDPAKIEPLITERTRAIIVVHLHGLPADMTEIVTTAKKHGLAVIEDGAQAHGATYRGKKVGALGDCAAFSLNATKNLPAGEGGLFVTSEDSAYRAAQRLSMCGEDVERGQDPTCPAYLSHSLGWNYRCSELTAALARTQLQRLDAVNRRVQENATMLNRGLALINGIVPPSVPDDRTCVWHKYRFRIDREALDCDRPPAELRDRFLRALQAEGVAASLWHTHPLPANPAFRRSRLEPWIPGDHDDDLEPWNPGSFPAASGLLDGSLLLGSERAPICAQSPELMCLYVEAVGKIVENLSTLLDLPIEKIQRPAPWRRTATSLHRVAR